MAHRIQPHGSGCPVHKKQLLPLLVVWASPRKKRNQEQHALNGNTSPSVAGSPPRSARQRVHIANDDVLEPTLVLPATALDAVANEPGRLHTDLEARLERLFARGMELAGTLVCPKVDVQEMGIVAATEAHRQHILTVEPDWHNRPVMMQLALGALAVCNRRPSDCTPVEEVNTLWALEVNSHFRGHKGVLFSHHGFSWQGVFSSSTLRRAKAKNDGAGRSLPQIAGPPRGVTVTRFCVEWWL